MNKELKNIGVIGKRQSVVGNNSHLTVQRLINCLLCDNIMNVFIVSITFYRVDVQRK